MAAAIDNNNKEYILGVDFGSTLLVASICNLKAEVVSKTKSKIHYVYPETGGVEIQPEVLWNTFVTTVKRLFQESGISASQIKTFGFCSQRGTVALWNKKSGYPYCNFISWQDVRSHNTVDNMNKSWMKRAINVLGAVMYTFLRQTRWMLMRAVNFTTQQAGIRTTWFLNENPEVREAAKRGEVLLGTIDTYIMWKLSDGQLHVTDASAAGGTGMYDPYMMKWSELNTLLFDIPLTVFPEVIDTSGHILDVDEKIFGASFPLTSAVGDTQASVFGQHCFNIGDAATSLGTGCFLTVNTGEYCHASLEGIYPQVAWRIEDKTSYICEGAITGVAASIEWAGQIGLYEEVAESSNIAKSVEDSAGMYYVPGFGGLSAPYKDPKACAGLIGMKLGNSSKAHVLRAICEGIAFRFNEMYEVMREETHVPFDPVIRVCGGISNNDFIMELISALTNCTIEKAHYEDTSLLGAVYLAGLGAGIWNSLDDIVALKKPPRLTKPDPLLRQRMLPVLKQWKLAVHRCLQWYD